ncbi:hypothetical protein KDW36_29650, partial [Burkholderia dolosa]|uniref:hypothetical protein n=1 Tax=Burkholderia dolosa TaxID=152500 RepID=UPI001B943DFE
MIQLHRCKQDNPFDRFPELRTIWPEPHLQALAEQATIETLDAQTVPGTPDRGPIFLILDIDAAGYERVVGISGYYTLDDRAEQLGLRWHGIVPRARGHGFSRLAFEQVLQTIRTSLPNAREIDPAPIPRTARSLITFWLYGEEHGREGGTEKAIYEGIQARGV